MNSSGENHNISDLCLKCLRAIFLFLPLHYSNLLSVKLKNQTVHYHVSFCRRMIALFLVLISLNLVTSQKAFAEPYVPTPEEMVMNLAPDEKAEAAFKSWKGVEVARSAKSQDDAIPKFTLYVTFEFNSADLTTDGELLLSQLGLALIDKRLRRFTFSLNGHTDAVGSESNNLDLSLRRAESVRKYLINNYNIPSSRLFSQGFGETQLLNTETPEAGENRRVEIANIGPDNQ